MCSLRGPHCCGPPGVTLSFCDPFSRDNGVWPTLSLCPGWPHLSHRPFFITLPAIVAHCVAQIWIFAKYARIRSEMRCFVAFPCVCVCVQNAKCHLSSVCTIFFLLFSFFCECLRTVSAVLWVTVKFHLSGLAKQRYFSRKLLKYERNVCTNRRALYVSSISFMLGMLISVYILYMYTYILIF